MEKRKPTALGIVVLVLSVLLAVGVASFAGPCVHDDGSAAMCQSAGTVLLGLGIAMVVVSLIRLFFPRNRINGILAGATAVLGLLAALLPGTAFPLCMMATMHCNAVMHPFGLVVGILICIFALVDAIMMHRAAGKPARRDA